MADGISITDLEQKVEVSDNDNFAVDNGTSTNKVTAKQIKDYMEPTYVKKAGDTMAGLLYAPAPSDDSRDNAVPNTAWVQNKLDGKAATDLSNISWEAVTPTVAFLQKGFKVCLPDVSNGYIDIAENTPYTCPQDGWVWTRGYFTGAGGQTITASVNGNALPNIGYNGSSTYNFDSPQWFPVAKGDVWQCNRTSRFYGLRG